MTLMFIYLYICDWGHLRKEKKTKLFKSWLSHIKTRNCCQPVVIECSFATFGLEHRAFILILNHLYESLF